MTRLSAPAGERWHPALAALSLLGFAALAGLPFLRSAPNRLLSGEPVLFAALLQGPSLWAVAALLALLPLLALRRPTRGVLWSSVALAALLLPGLLCVAAGHAAQLAQTLSPLARTSLGAGFWLAWLALALVAADALQRLAAPAWQRALLLAGVLLVLFALLASGRADELSIMKEYANRADSLPGQLLRHLQIVGIALLLTVAAGLPLGWAAHRWGKVGGALFPVLNIIQTIPSIALFGLLMAPLALLAASLPALARAGIGGVGLAPGVIALTLYSLLPVARGTLAGLAQVPSAVVEAARGLGMSRPRIFVQVELPLALPVLLAGLRTAAIQAVGLAAVTALIGAGGLGAIMFEGLFSNAQDLVLLGVVPLVALGALTDQLFRLLIAATAVRGAAPEAAP